MEQKMRIPVVGYMVKVNGHYVLDEERSTFVEMTMPQLISALETLILRTPSPKPREVRDEIT